MNPHIYCESLSKHYSGIKALDGLNLELTINEPTGIVGPNGAGKSTLFAILCGFVRPGSGKVRILGEKPDCGKIKGKFSLLPQDTQMFRNIDVRSQLKHYARLQGLDNNSANKEIDKVISLVQAESFAKQYPETLSFGQRKRVMLAQTLIGNPELILMDEPTSGLDPVAATEVHHLLQKLSQHHRIVISSHNLKEIEDICGDIAILNKGKLVIHTGLSELKRTTQCFSLRLEKKSELHLSEVLTNIPEITHIENDKNDMRSYLVHYDKCSAEQLQVKILTILGEKNIAVSEFRKGKALADEISAILKNTN